MRTFEKVRKTARGLKDAPVVRAGRGRNARGKVPEQPEFNGTFAKLVSTKLDRQLRLWYSCSTFGKWMGEVCFRLFALVKEYVLVGAIKGEARHYYKFITYLRMPYPLAKHWFIEHCKPFEGIRKRRKTGLVKRDGGDPICISPLLKKF